MRWAFAGFGAAAVLVGAIVVGRLLLTRSEEPAALTSPTPSVTPAAVTTAAPSPTPTATSDPSVAKHLKPLVSSWRPADTTVIVVRQSAQGAEFTIVAIPAGGGSATPLITVPVEPKNWDMRRDGSALVVSVGVAQDRSRLATWDLRTGLLRWITGEEAGTFALSPRWSPDGAVVYFGRHAGSDLGLFRVKADGTDLQRIRGPLPPGQPPFVSIPHLVTDEGVLLWGPAYEGTGLAAIDLASGRERSGFASCAELESWRPTQPRALVLTGVCGIGRSVFGLALWDDVAGTTTTLTDPSQELTLGADWDLTGTRIVAAIRPASGSEPFALTTMDVRGGARTRLPATENARSPLWLRAGVAYLWSARLESLGDGQLDFGPPFEVRLVAPSGGTPRTLYRSNDYLMEIRFVRP